MIRIGITGHQRLDDESAWPWVSGALGRAIAELQRPFAALSSLAIGADQLLAWIALEQGGALDVVLPFADYRTRFAAERDARQYDALLLRASSIEVLPPRESDEQSYLAAGQRIVDRSDAMFAVWNGQQPAEAGGTGDIVHYARAHGRPLTVFDPVTRTVYRPAAAGE